MYDRHLLLILLIQISLATTVFSQYSLQAYSYCADEQSYIDIYSRLPVGELPVGADVVRQILLVQGVDTVYADLARVDRPLGLSGADDIYDLHRVSVEPNRYEVIVSIIMDSDVVLQSMQARVDVASCPTLLLSDIMLVSATTPCLDGPTCKYNKVMEPLLGHSITDSIKTAYLYVEYYDRGVDAAYLSYGLKNDKNQPILSHRRLGADPLQVLILPLSTALLSNDQYEVFVEVYDANKALLYRQTTSLQIVNVQETLAEVDVNVSWIDDLSTEQLIFDVKSLLPILGNADVFAANAVLVDRKKRSMAKLVAKYWSENQPDDPEGGYRAYRQVAEAVHERFYNTVGSGVETDRGYLYLRYGKPNDIIKVEDEPDAPPYQIWRYNYVTATRQSNVKFIFYNPSLVTNDYYLLHSTCRGELQNPQWEVELYSKAPWDQADNRVDGTKMTDGYNRQARRLFESM